MLEARKEECFLCLVKFIRQQHCHVRLGDHQVVVMEMAGCDSWRIHWFRVCCDLSERAGVKRLLWCTRHNLVASARHGLLHAAQQGRGDKHHNKAELMASSPQVSGEAGSAANPLHQPFVGES